MNDNALGQNRPIAGILTRLGAMLSLAIMFAFVKLAGQDGVHVTESLFYRQLTAMPLICFLIWRSEAGWPAIKSNKHKLHILRSFLGIFAMGLNFWAMMLLPLADATTISFTVPIFATLFAALILREKVGIRRWSAILIGFVGVLIVIQPGGTLIPAFGASVALVGALVTASVTLVIRMLGRTETSIVTIFWFSVYTLPALAICAYIYGGGHEPRTWLYLLGIGMFGALGQLTITQSLRYAPVSTIVPMDYTALIWATMFGILIFGQYPGLSIWLGAPIIIGSGLFIAWREHVKSSKLTVAQVEPVA
ncbi:DMT family transporter [Parasphingorhabdus halotolerans]|uniref:DMT family transporter n=1 Tax=Parasphingorhabdus halotolerans TaxID=2725558 RepID=A0A6H2DLY9_9SPHN|nr:DMT family transporter [Parasphingorhabdus halotolerans]QJB69003.1 DMT family transporter [Parasphingorhabdus halotolerans]